MTTGETPTQRNNEMLRAIAVDTIRTGLRVYLYGHHSDVEKLRKEGSMALRVGGQLLGSVSDPSFEEVTDIISAVHTADVGFEQVDGLLSLMSARIAEGLYESGRNPVAMQLVESGMLREQDKMVAVNYFGQKDWNLPRYHHINV